MNESPPADPAAEARVKIAEKLTSGITFLTAALGIVAAYKDGLGRMALNNAPALTVALILILLAVVLAVAAWTYAQQRKIWGRLVAASAVLSLLGIGGTLLIAQQSTEAYDRPQVTASYDGTKLSFSAKAGLIPADGTLTVTVYGYPAGIATDISSIPAQSNVPNSGGTSLGSQLFFTHIGPNPDGSAEMTGSVPVAPSAFEQVEVRAYRSEVDSLCLSEAPGRRDRTACATVWLAPRPPGAP